MLKRGLKIVVIAALLPVSSALAQSSGYVPEGYTLTWADEFDDKTDNGKPLVRPDKGEWYYETGGGGWGNNELQYYVSGITGQDTLAAVKNGVLTIKAIKKTIASSPYASIRMNTTKAWQYGYFEMKAKMPTGRGTWPAFWMLSENFTNWPLDGEIDIMEYVGYDPNVVHGTIHTQSYNHMLGTQRGNYKKIENAESEYHVYALKWTADKIRVYVDGYNYFTFSNDEMNNKNTWPFNSPFYLKLNLAIGGNWGGAQGVDETILSASYQIDYVRVYQVSATNATMPINEQVLAQYNGDNNTLLISTKKQGRYSIYIFNLQGSIVSKREINSDELIDCSGFTSGCYLVRLSDGETHHNYKFIK